MAAADPSDPEKWIETSDAGTSANNALENKETRTSSDSSSSSLGQPHPQDNALRPVVTAQDWTGPDDPENPLNWPLWQKAYITICVALVGFAMTFASSVYTPSNRDIAIYFDVSPTVALLGLTVYVIGLAFGPIVSAPISETFGRSVVYKVTVPISMLFTLGAGFSTSFASLLVCRFFAAFAGSAVLAVGAGTNVDIWPQQTRAIATSSFLVAPFLGPSLGPFIGGFIAQNKGWQWTQWCILFVTLAVYLMILPTKETYKKIILQKRAKRLSIPPPPSPLANQPPLAVVKFILTVTLFRPIHMLGVEPIVLFLSIYTAFAFSILFCFFAAFPTIFLAPPYNFTISQAGLVWLAIGFGVLVAGGTAILLDRILYQKVHKQAIEKGSVGAQPEHRLYAAMGGSLGLPIGLFWFAWTAGRDDIHWIVPVLGTVPIAWGNLSLFVSTALYLVDVYGPLNGASALAANGILRYASGAVFPLFTVQMYKALGIGWATSLLGFISVAMIPIPWVLFKYGPKIRSKSQYDTVKF